VNQQFAGNFSGVAPLCKGDGIDHNFARACRWRLSPEPRTVPGCRCAKLAMEHIDRITDRERGRVRAMYYMRTEKWQKCIEEYGEL
jgi:hypothetical protein